MYPYEFAYWLKGYFELSNSSNLSEEQVKIIKEHLQKVFSVNSGTAGIQMHPDEFVYWLKDYLVKAATYADIDSLLKGVPLNNSNLSEEKVNTIKEYLQKVFSFSSGTSGGLSPSSSGSSGIQAFSGTC